MALDQSALSELLDAVRAGGELDVIGSAVELMLQALIELEAGQVIGAERYERAVGRTRTRPVAMVADGRRSGDGRRRRSQGGPYTRPVGDVHPDEGAGGLVSGNDRDS